MTALAMPGVALALGAFHDTLERVRRSEATERQTGETLVVIIGAAPAAVITTDVEGGVKLWNPAAQQMFGWTSAEVIGMPPPNVPPDRTGEDRGARDGALAGDPARDLRTVGLTKDGRALDVSLSIATIRDTRGERTGTVDTPVDITDQKRQEAQRVGAQRAELLGRLTAGAGRAGDHADPLRPTATAGSPLCARRTVRAPGACLHETVTNEKAAPALASRRGSEGQIRVREPDVDAGTGPGRGCSPGLPATDRRDQNRQAARQAPNPVGSAMASAAAPPPGLRGGRSVRRL